MKIAHIADCHLGFKAFERTSDNGINTRELDNCRAFAQCVDQVIEACPHLVIIAGDLFHNVRPSNNIIVFAFKQISKLKAAGFPVLLTAGNHDTPKSQDTEWVGNLIKELGVDVAIGREKVFYYDDIHVLAVPHMEKMPSLFERRDHKYNVITLHGEVPGLLPLQNRHSSIIHVDMLHEWDYIALGHYHVLGKVANNAWYSGSLEYVTTNIWGELEAEADLDVPGKGWLLVDLESKIVKPMWLKPQRGILDLEPINAHAISSIDIMDLINSRVNSVSIDNNVVRLKVLNIPRVVERTLDWKRIHELKAIALNFNLDFRRYETIRSQAQTLSRSTSKHLDVMLKQHLQQRVLPEDLNRAEFVKLGSDLMEGTNNE